MQSGPVTGFLRYLRRMNRGGAIEYVGQLLGGLIHPQLMRPGATLEDERRPLLGDELVPRPVWEATRAVTIDAPAPLETAQVQLTRESSTPSGMSNLKPASSSNGEGVGAFAPQTV